MLLISVLFAELYSRRKNEKYKYLYMLLSTLPFFLVSALRYDVGTDYFYRYVPDFQAFIAGKEVLNLEIGFRLLYWLLSFITKDYAIVFVATSFLIIFPIFYTIFKYSKRPSISILLFFLSSYFFVSLNMVRQFVAIAILFSTVHFLLEKKYKPWLFFVLLATCIHKSSLIFLLPFLLRKKMYLSPAVITVLGVILILFANPLHEVINFLLSFTPFSHYANTVFSKMDLQITPLIVNLCVYVFLYYFYKASDKKKKQQENNDIFFINMQGFAVLCYFLSGTISIFSRVSYFFSIFSILSIANFAYKKFDKKAKILLIILCVIMAGALTKTHLIANSDEVFPYKAIWQRTSERT